MKAEQILDCKNGLGEGPIWNSRNNSLLWIDFDKGNLCTYHLPDKMYQETYLAADLMLCLPTTSDNYLLAAGRELIIWDNKAEIKINALTLRDEPAANRLNDGKCDAKNRLWIGTMNRGANSGAGALYKIEAGLRYTKMEEGYTIPNGIAWNKNNTEMYVVDSAEKKVFKYAFDLEAGTIGQKQVLIDTSSLEGLPDGMTIDEEDRLWIAFWEGGSLIQFDSATGYTIRKVNVPANIPTSCCFGGKDLDLLYITSSRRYDSPKKILEFPFAGGLFAVKTGCKGLLPNFYKE
jgi:sugar lactone lactonase YvrE